MSCRLLPPAGLSSLRYVGAKVLEIPHQPFAGAEDIRHDLWERWQHEVLRICINRSFFSCEFWVNQRLINHFPHQTQIIDTANIVNMNTEGMKNVENAFTKGIFFSHVWTYKSAILANISIQVEQLEPITLAPLKAQARPQAYPKRRLPQPERALNHIKRSSAINISR